VCFPVIATSNDIGLNQLFSAWHQVKTADKHFIEEQFDSLLEISQTKSGVMHYQSPNFLKQQYKKPFTGTVIFNDNKVKIDFPNRKLEIPLAQFTEVAMFSEMFLDILNGNLLAIQKNFTLKFTEKINTAWQLRLTPKNNFKSQFQDIVLKGRKTDIESILLTQKSGDWRKITLQPNALNSSLNQ